VVTADGVSVVDEVADESSELEESEDVGADDALESVAVDESEDVVAVEASVVAPIEPSKTITPHARAKAATDAATMRRRTVETRRARAASSSRPRAARSEGVGLDGMTPT
jgi:hypothetical protein